MVGHDGGDGIAACLAPFCAYRRVVVGRKRLLMQKEGENLAEFLQKFSQ
ncbi:MAG: hypothetical protein K2L60_03100 [Bacteroides sp.]|nr:hypothetical protein [Bacteroides sp.]